MFNKLRKKLLPDKVPEDVDVSPTEYSFFIVANRVSVAAFLVHALFLGIFLWIEIPELVLFNVMSCGLYLATYFLNRRGYYNLVLFLVISEIVLHGVLAVYYLGVKTGFQYYMIAIIPVMFFSALQSHWLKFIGAGLIGAIYVILDIYSNQAEPVYFLAEPTLLNLRYLNIILVFSVIGIPAYYYNAAVIETRRRLKELNKKLKKLALRDSLTNLLNRRAMNRKIEQKVEKGEESNFVMIIADIDDFKMVNDQYGHNYGDFVLKEIAKLMKYELKGYGMVSRWGGEEFLIFLPQVKLKQGLAVAKRLKEKIANHDFRHKGKSLHITITMGVSEYNAGIDLEECIREADQALYRGKQTGKNKVAAY